MDTQLQPEGNYSLDVLSAALRVYGDLQLQKLAYYSGNIPCAGVYLMGNGNHWTVAQGYPHKKWTLLDNGVAYPISSITDYARKYAHSPNSVMLHVHAVSSSAAIDVDDDGSRPRKSDPASATFADSATGATPPRAKRSRSAAAAAGAAAASSGTDAAQSDGPIVRRSPFLDTFGAN